MGVLILDDEYFMGEALKEANCAKDLDEVPIGAVIVLNDRIISRAYNLTQKLNDVTAHAEMQAAPRLCDPRRTRLRRLLRH